MVGDNETLRQRSLDLLARCLVPASAPATALELAWVEAVAAHAARQVEAAAWCSHSGRAYRQKIRFLASSLKRPECHAVLQQVLNGQVSAFELVSWPEEDFLGEARREQRAKHRAEAMSEVLLKEGCSVRAFLGTV
ncbi:unnamed protein product [Effrenium voratum]|nr:unnamed protein product [Effrenium voratum]